MTGCHRPYSWTGPSVGISLPRIRAGTGFLPRRGQSTRFGGQVAGGGCRPSVRAHRADSARAAGDRPGLPISTEKRLARRPSDARRRLVRWTSYASRVVLVAPARLDPHPDEGGDGMAEAAASAS